MLHHVERPVEEAPEETKGHRSTDGLVGPKVVDVECDTDHLIDEIDDENEDDDMIVESCPESSIVKEMVESKEKTCHRRSCGNDEDPELNDVRSLHIVGEEKRRLKRTVVHDAAARGRMTRVTWTLRTYKPTSLHI